jgi:hypothetical protein
MTANLTSQPRASPVRAIKKSAKRKSPHEAGFLMRLRREGA